MAKPIPIKTTLKEDLFLPIKEPLIDTYGVP
jgi:hypothetical protein